MLRVAAVVRDDRVMIRLFHALLLVLACLTCRQGSAWAQGAFSGGAPHIAVRLVAESNRPAPGGKVTLAFEMTPEAGWHGYWENPGDAGKGMNVVWQLPAGVKAGGLRYPVPQKLLISGLMNHVYEGPYAVLVELALPTGMKAGESLPVRVRADWLACTDTICVPEGADLMLNLSAGDGVVGREARERFDGYRARLPRPLGGLAHFTRKGDLLRIAVPFPAEAAIADPWFFRRTEGVASYAVPQSFSRNGDVLVIETRTAGPSLARLEGVLKIAPHVGLEVSAQPGAVPPAGMPLGPEPSGWSMRTVWLALAGALLGGLLLNVMPCVFPILSLKAISLAKVGGNSAEAKKEALAYSAGVVMTCLALGALLLTLRAGGQQVGWAFQLQNTSVILLLCIVSWAITLNLAGGFALQAIDAGGDLTRKGGTHGAFWTGVLVAFVATPCTGPFMAAALGAALLLPAPAALAIFAGLGLGLSLPFLAIAFIPFVRNRMPRPGAWMKTMQRLLAIPMAVTTLALLWLVQRQAGGNGFVIALGLIVLASMLLLALGWRQRRAGAALTALGLGVLLLMAGAWGVGAKLLPTVNGAEPSQGADQPFSETALAEARAAGKPVFLYFTADWCLSCKVNEAASINRTEVRQAFRDADVIVMEGDWTNGDANIGRFLEEHGRSGVPLYLWYAPGAVRPRELSQILTPALLKGLAQGGRR